MIHIFSLSFSNLYIEAKYFAWSTSTQFNSWILNEYQAIHNAIIIFKYIKKIPT